MKFIKAFKFIGIIAVTAAIIVLVYHLFLKEEAVEISSEELSKMMNMEISFQSYELFDSSTLEITGLSIKSPYPKSRYKEVNEYHTDWIDAKIKKIRLVNFNYDQLIRNKQFFASSIEVDSAKIEVYRDKTLSNPPFKYKPLVIEMIKKAGADIIVDTVYLQQVNITYLERTRHSQNEPGKISFKNLFATGYNLTNDSVHLAQNPQFIIDVQSDIMGEATINAHMIFHMTENYFTFSANIGPFNAAVLNPVIEGTLPVTITEGEVENIKVDFTANNEKSNGNVDFQYKDMQFKLFDSEGSEIKSFITTQAAKAALKNTNLKSENNYEQGKIAFERYEDKFIFNYWWNSLKSGLIDAMLSDTVDKLIDVKTRKDTGKYEKDR